MGLPRNTWSSADTRKCFAPAARWGLIVLWPSHFDVQQCTPPRCEAYVAAFVAESKAPTGERPTCRLETRSRTRCSVRFPGTLGIRPHNPALRRGLRHGAQHPVVVRALQQGEGRQDLVLNRSQPSKVARVRPEQVQASIDPTRGVTDCREWRRSLARTPHSPRRCWIAVRLISTISAGVLSSTSNTVRL